MALRLYRDRRRLHVVHELAHDREHCGELGTGWNALSASRPSERQRNQLLKGLLDGIEGKVQFGTLQTTSNQRDLAEVMISRKQC
jgi:hypothetical protein